MGNENFNQIGWCLEEIQKVMAKLPNKIETNDDVILANDILSKVINLSMTLEKVITNKNFLNVLHTLENQVIEGIKFQAEHIEKLFSSLNNALNDLDKYINQLKRILDKRGNSIIPDNSLKSEWQKIAGNITHMIVDEFGTMYYELREEFKVVLHTEEQLKNLQIYEEYLKEVLK